ncbi:uncharacterized protein Z519_02397 [Cladophialophora bantiana CBS 173.52]|uniref:Protein-lysine N-methyltransferase EFM4 n=1 Tax=Cladophialophora bantiana (strain ATCC 10958 / CBS 173.52 / CDC B-1940 / NIH 8579) TaxID=1442370 RepID=A0A0D2F4A3_CLAB1|nr:uncharacterized protein Z519_02397 [Cladophialophora bantiana CBS 173.52]KIW97006.1 hypothetical protein Z519_02397 [Cladophialophora bantiana CBS 173.52]
MSLEKSHPVHLEPSELGTKEYWDEYYQNDLENGAVHSDDEDDAEIEDGSDEKTGSEQQPPDPSELESWFDDVGAPAKTLAFLTSTTFPLSPNYVGLSGNTRKAPSVLDLGTGNGSALFALRLHGHYTGRMVGVDYSSKSVELARRLRVRYASAASSATDSGSSVENMAFEVFDIIHDSPHAQPWWDSSLDPGGFDLVLDKGTFDAISLSSATVADPASSNRHQRRMCELYPAKVLQMVKAGGYLLVTSCNWTEAEVVAWFTTCPPGGRENEVFEVYDAIKYPVFEFGGQKGQGVASVCFRKPQRTETDQG